jgi:ABC-type multidrug transport system ATPase subunit
MSGLPETIPESFVQPIISIKDVSKTYASGVEALKPTSLDIMSGEIFALLGPNGAGKTTLINISHCSAPTAPARRRSST